MSRYEIPAKYPGMSVGYRALGRLLRGTYWLLFAVDVAGLVHQLALGAPDRLLVSLLTVATLCLALRLFGRFWHDSI